MENARCEIKTGPQTLLESRLALGMGGIFEGKEAKLFSRRDYISMLEKSIDFGFRLVDTAPAYGDGVSEQIVGEVAVKQRSELVIATKVSPHNLSFQGVAKSAEESLRRLRTDYIDLLQVHWPNPTIPLEETAQAMLSLVEAKKVRWLGAANFSVPELSEFASYLPKDVFISSQVEMSIIDRFEISRGLRWSEETSRVTLAYSPLGKGRLAQNPTIYGQLSKIADELGASIPQLLLRWLSELGRVVPIVASRNPLHLLENLASQEIVLDNFDFGAITQVLEQVQEHHLIPSEITVATDGDGGRSVYRTVEEAEANELGFSPSPRELAEQFLTYRDIKPVRVQRRGGRFFLVEGRVRYWAWVIAFGDEERIPSIEVNDVVS